MPEPNNDRLEVLRFIANCPTAKYRTLAQQQIADEEFMQETVARDWDEFTRHSEEDYHD